MTLLYNAALTDREALGLEDGGRNLELSVRELLYELRVLSKGNDKFGLRWVYGSADKIKAHIGGWLLQSSASGLKKGSTRGKLCFFILDDDERVLRQCKDETVTHTYRTLEYGNVDSVMAMRDPASGLKFLEIGVKAGAAKKKAPVEWVLMPIQNKNHADEYSELMVVRWAAALRQRCGLMSEALLDAEARSMRAVIWVQSQVRMRRAIEKADRRRQRRAGAMNKLSSLIYGYVDSEDEEDGDTDSAMTDLEHDTGQEQQSSNVLVRFVPAVAVNIFSGDGKLAGKTRPIKGSGKSKGTRISTKRMSRLSLEQDSLFPPSNKNNHKKINNLDSESFVQEATVLAPLKPHEIEDELWENERWTPKWKWNAKSLLPSDRAAFTDRIGRGSYKNLNDMEVPDGWVVCRDWELDLSGQISGRSGADGWIHGINFPPMDSALAKGAPKVTKTGHSLVRRRRYFRRRVPELHEDRLSAFVVWHGWLGKKVESSGRWNNRYFVLTRGLQLHGRSTGVALSYFRAGFTEHLDVVGNNDLKLWNSLSTKDLKTYTCDGAHILHNTSSMHRNAPTFQLGIASQVAPLQLTSDSSWARDVWVYAIEHSIKDQINRFALTKSPSLELKCSFMDTPGYQNVVLDRLVPLPVDQLFTLLFFNLAFERKFEDACRFKLVKSDTCHKDTNIPKHLWNMEQKKGSCREKLFFTPHKNKRARKHGTRAETIFKQQIVRTVRGEGYQVDMCIQRPADAYGNISINEVRFVLFNWHEKNSRVVVTHHTKIRTDDESIKIFVESTGRRFILKLFFEAWLPLVQQNLKERRNMEVAKRNNKEVLTSATGIIYSKSGCAIKADGYAY